MTAERVICGKLPQTIFFFLFQEKESSKTNENRGKKSEKSREALKIKRKELAGFLEEE